jgi:hypothetical protein
MAGRRNHRNDRTQLPCVKRSISNERRTGTHPRGDFIEADTRSDLAQVPKPDRRPARQIWPSVAVSVDGFAPGQPLDNAWVYLLIDGVAGR